MSVLYRPLPTRLSSPSNSKLRKSTRTQQPISGRKRGEQLQRVWKMAGMEAEVRRLHLQLVSHVLGVLMVNWAHVFNQLLQRLLCGAQSLQLPTPVPVEYPARRFPVQPVAPQVRQLPGERVVPLQALHRALSPRNPDGEPQAARVQEQAQVHLRAKDVVEPPNPKRAANKVHLPGLVRLRVEERALISSKGQSPRQRGRS